MSLSSLSDYLLDMACVRISRIAEGTVRTMSRVRELDETANAIKNSEDLSAEDIMAVILAEIAGSLAVIADVLANKDGENHKDV